MLAVDALVREAGDALGEMTNPVNRHRGRLDAPHRRFAHDLDEELARAIGDDFDDGLVVQPLPQRPERVFEEDRMGVGVLIDEPWLHGAAPSIPL